MRKRHTGIILKSHKMKSTRNLPKQLLNLMIVMAVALMPIMSVGQIKGNGNMQKVNRSTSSFTQIEVGGAFDVQLSQGDTKVIVEADDNLLPYIETNVKEGVLCIRTKSKIIINKPASLKIYITAPDITSISMSGATNIKSTGILNYPKLDLEASGASDATLKINADKLEVDASGASCIKLELNARELETEASGASDITLSGSAINHHSEVSGAASIDVRELKSVTTTFEVSGAGDFLQMGK